MANSIICHPIASFSPSTFHSHRFSKRNSGNVTWVRERRRLYVKSTKSDSKTDETSQTSTSSTSGNTSSFLSFLCPLLKVFSVSPPLLYLVLSKFRFFLEIFNYCVFSHQVSRFLVHFCVSVIISQICDSNICQLLFPGRWSFSRAESCSGG